MSFTPSVEASIFRVRHVLKVYVKHDAWNKFGRGEVVNFPIKIIQPPIEVLADKPAAKPENWNPVP